MELKYLILSSATLRSTKWKHVENGLGLEHSVLEPLKYIFNIKLRSRLVPNMLA